MGSGDTILTPNLHGADEHEAISNSTGCGRPTERLKVIVILSSHVNPPPPVNVFVLLPLKPLACFTQRLGRVRLCSSNSSPKARLVRGITAGYSACNLVALSAQYSLQMESVAAPGEHTSRARTNGAPLATSNAHGGGVCAGGIACGWCARLVGCALVLVCDRRVCLSSGVLPRLRFTSSAVSLRRRLRLRRCGPEQRACDRQRCLCDATISISDAEGGAAGNVTVSAGALASWMSATCAVG